MSRIVLSRQSFRVFMKGGCGKDLSVALDQKVKVPLMPLSR